MPSPQDYPIANPSDAEFHERLFLMWFGQIGTQHVYVWAGSFDSAWEEAVEWLDDEGMCGFFTTITEEELREAAEDLGIPWPGIEALSGVIDEDASAILEEAETDLTMVSHTSLRNCEKKLEGGPLYVPSYEWGGSEIYGDGKWPIYLRSVGQELRLGYAVLNVFQRYWEGQGDPLYAVLSRRGTSVDIVTVVATPAEVDRLAEVADEILESDDSDEGERRTAEELLDQIEALED